MFIITLAAGALGALGSGALLLLLYCRGVTYCGEQDFVLFLLLLLVVAGGATAGVGIAGALRGTADSLGRAFIGSLISEVVGAILITVVTLAGGTLSPGSATLTWLLYVAYAIGIVVIGLGAAIGYHRNEG